MNLFFCYSVLEVWVANTQLSNLAVFAQIVHASFIFNANPINKVLYCSFPVALLRYQVSCGAFSGVEVDQHIVKCDMPFYCLRLALGLFCDQNNFKVC